MFSLSIHIMNIRVLSGIISILGYLAQPLFSFFFDEYVDDDQYSKAWVVTHGYGSGIVGNVGFDY